MKITDLLNKNNIFYFIAIIVSIFSIGSTAIGIQAYDNKNTKLKDDMPSNHGFLIFSLIVVLVFMCFSGYMVYKNKTI
jgi:hypothetical protein